MKPLLAALSLMGALLLNAQTSTDLEVGGGVPGVAAGATRLISYHDLLALPQVSFTSSADTNFPQPARLSGVTLEQLTRRLVSDADMVVAICADGYRTNYPAAYLAAHHPVLVLTVDGKAPKDWPKTQSGGALGPYLISSAAFVPSFKVLAHTDEAQIPFEVVRLDFRKESQVFGAIAPRGNFAADSPVMNGYRIAQQNCFRCHNMGAEGGKMAAIPWQVLGGLAKGSPVFFARYVRNPQTMNPRSRMAASPEYDDQTIAALEAYFSTFAAGEQK